MNVSNIKKSKDCKIGKITIVGNGEIILGDSVVIQDNVTLNIDEKLIIGDRTVIKENSEISGRYVTLGKECWLDKYSLIGGGGCHGKHGILNTGDWLHTGMYSIINIEKEVNIGSEVGLGVGTRIYTHGRYLNYLEGFPISVNPITIGSNVWLPNATVLPNVTIGSNVVVAAMSLVNRDLPSGCLAGGIPAHVIREKCFPNISKFNEHLKIMLDDFCDNEYYKKIPEDLIQRIDDEKVLIEGTLFDFKEKRIDGKVTEWSERFKDYCRRWGIRFRYYADNEMGIYKSW